jgi:hypothetical protein
MADILWARATQLQRHPTIKDRYLDIPDEGIPFWMRSSGFRNRAHRLKFKGEDKGEETVESGSKKRKLSPQGSILDQLLHLMLILLTPSAENPVRTLSLPAQSPHVAICEENNWIEPLAQRWSAPPFTTLPSRLFTQGLEILQALLNQRSPLALADRNVQVGYILKPVTNYVVGDIMNLKKGEVEQMDVVDYTRVSPSPCDVLTSLTECPAITDWDTNPSRRMLAALSIPMKPTGLGICGLNIEGPLREHSIVHMERKKNLDIWNSTISPEGALTNPHHDFYGATQVMCHIGGGKLWLMWPRTVHNLRWYNSKVRDRLPDPKFNIILDAINLLEGMTVLHAIWEPFGFIVPPYVLHAVLTFKPSSHAATKMWTYEHFDQSLIG